MSLQSKEIETLQGQIKALEAQKAKAEATWAAELEKSHRFLEKFQQVERDTSLARPYPKPRKQSV